MGKANPYVHIPKESFPSWIWYAAECVGLIVIAFLSAVQITNTFEGLTCLLYTSPSPRDS